MADPHKADASDQDYLTASALKGRGWTDALITRFLPEPDLEKPNPRFRSAAPMRLYALSRVERVEATRAFEVAWEKAAARRRAAQKAAATKRARTVAYVEDEVEITVPRMSWSALVHRACDSYNDRNVGREGRGRLANKHSEPAFLDRIAVNYLRHEATPYEHHLDEVEGRVGVHDAYHLIRDRVLDAIAAAYPRLAEECERQRT